MVRPRDSLTKSIDLGQDGIGCCCPDEWPRVAMVLMDVLLNARDEFFDTAEGPASDRLLGDEVEPDLHLVKPGGVRRCMVDMPPGVS